MKYGVEIPTCREGVFDPTSLAGPNEIIQLIKLAEQLDYYAVWGTERGLAIISAICTAIGPMEAIH